MKTLKISQRVWLLIFGILFIAGSYLLSLNREAVTSMVLVKGQKIEQRTGLLVGSTNRKMKYVLTSQDATAPYTEQQEVTVVYPNKKGKDNKSVKGAVSKIDQKTGLVLIRLNKAARRNRALEFETTKENSVEMLVNQGQAKKQAAFVLQPYAQNQVAEIGLVPLLTKTELVNGVLLNGREVIPSRTIVTFLTKNKVKVHVDGSKKNELVMSSFAAANIALLYILMMFHRSRKKQTTKKKERTR